MLAVAAVLSLLSPVRTLAVDVASAPVGYVNITLLRASDTIVAVPLAAGIAYSGRITSILPSAGGQFIVKVSGAPAFASDQFKQFYYLRIGTGARHGAYFTIVANTADTLTLDSEGNDYSALAVGDTIKIRRYWTLGTLFPVAESNTPLNPLAASPGPLGPQRRSQIILFDHGYEGINLPAAGVYYFTSAGWYQAVTGNPRADDIVLHPDSSFIIRQPAVIAQDTVWAVAGSVVEEDERIPLFTSSSGPQDNVVALNRPFDTALSASGLDASFVASASTFPNDRRDQLLVFDNTVRAFNKTPVATYYRVGRDWIKAAPGNPTANDTVLNATTGLVIRKFRDATSASTEWVSPHVN
ncbi:TIGR02597 family protein [Horticoccus luteus]|uniref:TIGR02597 family protein n=1 Tax=Horticoccus luteus TaxID=2862869 RepID=A0A8F9TS09_9BACT|nr:TIGR02597 family protein [Horticoccus luteus]QYM77955.1 TIGR02597 family protein [Horticoccus luteus]